MVDEIYYEKNQLLIDEEGEIWILVDIIESKSLLTKKAKSTLTAFIRKKDLVGGKPKLVKMSFKKFSETLSPFLLTDQSTVDKVVALENLLSVDAIHPMREEN